MPFNFIIMARINNSELTKELLDGAKIQTLIDDVPSELGKTVVPVMEVNPKLLNTPNEFGDQMFASSGTFTLFTTPKDGDFYLNSLQVGYNKDSACNVATGGIYVVATINGEATSIVSFPVLTLVAQSDSAFVVFPKPIKIDKYTNITFTGTFTLGAMVRSGAITGIKVD